MSLFYSARFSQRFPVSLLALESLTNLSDLPADEAIPKILSECCGVQEPVEEDLVYLLGVLEEEAKKTNENNKTPPAAPTTKKTKTLWSSFNQFMSGLDSSRVLLWACGFDYKRAEYLYTKVDRSIANQIIADFVSMQQEQNILLLEATMYGFGGKYSEESESENTVDATEMGADALRKLLSQK